MPRFLDTNILLYAISSAPPEFGKRDRARSLIDEGDCALSVQVLQEFYVQATRQTRPRGLSHAQAVGFMMVWRRFPVQEITTAVMDRALSIKDRYGFSYWDSAVIAAAAELRCDVLFTEDMSHQQRVGGVLLIDPFR